MDLKNAGWSQRSKALLLTSQRPIMQSPVVRHYANIPENEIL